MTNDEDGIIDAEIVEDDRLPATVDQASTHDAQPPIEGRDWSKYSRPERRCTAHSSRTGERCKNAAIKGGKVCRYHGGNAPHVIANARARLQNAADLMARELLGIALTADTESVKLAAIRDALDRAGLRPPSEVVLSQGEAKPYEKVFDAIGGNPSDSLGYDDSAGIESASTAMVDPADEQSQWFSDAGPPGQPEGREFDRHAQPDARESARTASRPAPVQHITGMAAIQFANEANRAAGVFDEQRALESKHKRYRRP
jgi:hypothetical protein